MAPCSQISLYQSSRTFREDSKLPLLLQKMIAIVDCLKKDLADCVKRERQWYDLNEFVAEDGFRCLRMPVIEQLPPVRPFDRTQRCQQHQGASFEKPKTGRIRFLTPEECSLVRLNLVSLADMLERKRLRIELAIIDAKDVDESNNWLALLKKIYKDIADNRYLEYFPETKKEFAETAGIDPFKLVLFSCKIRCKICRRRLIAEFENPSKQDPFANMTSHQVEFMLRYKLMTLVSFLFFPGLRGISCSETLSDLRILRDHIRSQMNAQQTRSKEDHKAAIKQPSDNGVKKTYAQMLNKL